MVDANNKMLQYSLSYYVLSKHEYMLITYTRDPLCQDPNFRSVRKKECLCATFYELNSLL